MSEEQFQILIALLAKVEQTLDSFLLKLEELMKENNELRNELKNGIRNTGEKTDDKNR